MGQTRWAGFCKCLKSGGASRDRTDDLIVANSQPCPRRRDTEEVGIARKGSVHAAWVAVPCSAIVAERHGARAPETGRDRRVTTQVTTQNSRPTLFELSRGYHPGMPPVNVLTRVQKKFRKKFARRTCGGRSDACGCLQQFNHLRAG